MTWKTLKITRQIAGVIVSTKKRDCLFCPSTTPPMSKNKREEDSRGKNGIDLTTFPLSSKKIGKKIGEKIGQNRED